MSSQLLPALIYDPEATMDRIVGTVTRQVQHTFPIVGKQNILEVDNVRPSADWDMTDIEGQMQAKLTRRTWGMPIVGDLVLRDKATGKVLSSKEGARLLTLPAMNRHFAFIVDGKEYSVDKQKRLKSGVYARIKNNGELESQFNLAKGRGFRIGFNPESRRFTLSYGSTNVNLYHVMRLMGASDDSIRKVLGGEIFKANADRKDDSSRLARVMTDDLRLKDRNVPAEQVIRQAFDATELRPDTTRLTLGTGYQKVSADALLGAAGHLLRMSRGEAKPDPRDSLAFAELLDIDDFLGDRLAAMRWKISTKVKNRLDAGKTVDEVFSPAYFNQPVQSFFGDMSLAEIPKQSGPVDLMGSMSKVTIMGEGGISTPHQAGPASRMLDASHFGFLDPLHTPEGEKVGVNLHLALGAGKKGREPTVVVRNARTGAIEQKTALELYDKNVGFPDQFAVHPGSAPRALLKKVDVVGKENALVQVDPKDVDYILSSQKAMVGVAANLVPFLQNDSGPRVAYAMNHMSQALPLVHRERPLIASATGSTAEGAQTFESVVGRYFSARSPTDGVVTKVEPGAVYVRSKDGRKLSRVSIYNNYPLNDKTAFLHAEPVVKVGDRVEAGQLIADTNFTKSGDLALGTNLRVGYIPWFADTFEDSIVLSESAARKLTSEHLYKKDLDVDADTVVDAKKFRAMYPQKVTDEAAKKLDGDGVIKPGTKVEAGDVLVAALRKRTPTREELLLRGLSKSLVKPYSDASVTWDSQYPGVVERVVKQGDRILVHVKSEEPAEVGDKLCYAEDHEVLTRSGWKKVADLTLDDLVCSLNPDTGDIEYVNMEAIHRYPGDHEALYHVETTQVSMLVTQKHNLWAARRDKSYRLEEARSLHGKEYRLQQCGTWKGVRDQDEFVFPEMVVRAGQSGNGHRTMPAIHMPMDTYLMLLGAYLSEGHSYADGSNSYIEITQTKPEGRKILEDELVHRGIAFTNAGEKVRIYGKQMHLHFSQFGLSWEKSIPEWVYDLPPTRLRVLLDWLVWGDGHVNTWNRIIYTTTSSLLADGVQRLLLHLGSAGRKTEAAPKRGVIKGKEYDFRACYKIHQIIHKTRPTVNHRHSKGQNGQLEELQAYTGNVHCITLKKNHILYTRRNGKVHWSGNSGRHGNKGVIGCYDDQTEILTNSGWKLFADLQEEDRVASRRPDGTASFELPSERMEYDYEGELLGCAHKYLDYLVTPNHRMWVRGEHYRGKTARYKIREAGACHEKRLVHQVKAEFLYPETIGSTFTLPVAKNGRGHQCRLAFDTLTFFEFMGWYLSEGSLASYTSDGVGTKRVRVRSYKVQISQSRGAHPEECAQIEDVLSRMGVGWHYSGAQYTFSHKALYTYLKPLGKSFEKRIPRELFSGGREALRRLLLAFMAGDGSDESWGFTGKSNSKGLVDDLQEVATRLGMYATVYPVTPDTHRQRFIVSVRLDRGEVGSGGDGAHFRKYYKGKVYCVQVPGGLVYVRRNGKPFWCGNSVLPDEEMPHTADGKPLEILLNPLGILNRMIVGTVLETTLSKVAEKEGNQIAVSSFETDPAKRIVRVQGERTVTVGPHYRTVKTREGPKRVYVEGYTYERDYRTLVEEELERSGVADKEEVFDPSGKSLGKVLVGNQYIIKQIHQAQKKLSARSGGPDFDYDGNMAPRGSGDEGGQSMGELGLYALLAHGATNFIREGATWKSDASQDEVWTSIQSGDPLPVPKVPFAYNKFISLLRSMGVDVDRDGSKVRFRPMTDEAVLKLSNGELIRPDLALRAKDLQPEAGGLFDERITGGVHGDRWCLHPLTPVVTRRGLMRIGDIVDGRLPVEVMSYDFIRGEVVWKPVVGWFRHDVGGDTDERHGVLVFGQGNILGVSERHGVMQVGGDKVEAWKADRGLLVA